MKTFATVLCLLILVSCGKSSKKSTPAQMQVDDGLGVYVTNLVPVNPSVEADVSGTVRVSHYGDDFRIKVILKNAPLAYHRQYLQTGSSCPTMADDVNADGFIDAEESLRPAGKILIPMDGDLSGQKLGMQINPYGNYTYVQSTSYALMLSDLHQSDDVFNDDLVKLRDAELSLEARVIMIYGVTDATVLPNTVRSLTGETHQEIFPIACGVLSLTDTTAPQYEENQINQKPEPKPEVVIVPRQAPKPVPQAPVYRSRWSRAGDRVRGWWCRVRGCSIS